MLSPEYGITGQTIYPVYMVLNVCRTLAYLRTGQILTKAEGGEWALDNIPTQYRYIVETALAAYRDDSNDHALESINLQPFCEWGRGELAFRETDL